MAMLSSAEESRPLEMNLSENSSVVLRAGTIHSTIFTYKPVSQIIMHTLTMLKVVWNTERPTDTLSCILLITLGSELPADTYSNRALGSPAPIALVIQAFISANHVNTTTHQMVPSALKSKWPMAVRLAATLPLIEASNGVMVVPMFEPSTKAQAKSKVIQPLVHIISTIAKVAADDWMMAVTIMPTRANSSTEA